VGSTSTKPANPLITTGTHTSSITETPAEWHTVSASQLTTNVLLKVFRHIELSFSYYNASSKESLGENLSLTQSSTELNNKSAVRVDLTFSYVGKGKLVISIWATPNY